MSYPRTYRYSHGVEMKGANADESETGREEQKPQGQTTETTPKEQRSYGFTMFRPDEKKRAHLEQVAKKEIEDADARREARRPQYIHETPSRVGGSVNQYAATRHKQKAVTAASSGLEIQKKREKWQREKREAEEKEHRERKAKARAQAERNEVLRAIRTQEMEDRHRGAQRWKNQEFLDRLEKCGRYDGY